jgi:hypothetical protein
MQACSGPVVPAEREPLPRSTIDRPDDLAGYQVHVLYAVPSDQRDQARDTDGTIARSVGRFTQWMASQTDGRTIRIDTAQGQPDITFVRLPKSQDDLRSAPDGTFMALCAQVLRLGFTDPQKTYAIYAEGFAHEQVSGLDVAGQASSALRMAVTYSGQRVFAPSGAPMASADRTMVHELLHAFGFAPACAPNYTSTGHVTDKNDLMAVISAENPVLDPERTNYYGHGRQDCPDLAESPYLTSGK